MSWFPSQSDSLWISKRNHQPLCLTPLSLAASINRWQTKKLKWSTKVYQTARLRFQCKRTLSFLQSSPASIPLKLTKSIRHLGNHHLFSRLEIKCLAKKDPQAKSWSTWVWTHLKRKAKAYLKSSSPRFHKSMRGAC